MQSAHSYSGSLQAAPSPREKRHAALARKAAAAGIVLLRNDGVLPLAPDKPVALFGAGAGHTVKGGIGSGDVNNRANVSLYEGLQEAGVALTSEDWITDYEHRYTAARLASGIIDFEGVGPEVPVDSVVEIAYEPAVLSGDEITGTVDVLDVRFGSLWTNIPREMFLKLGVSYGDRVEVIIEKRGRTVYRTSLIYAHSFAEAYIGEALVYVNSLDFMAVAINQGNFARAYNVGTGLSWKIIMRKSTLHR